MKNTLIRITAFAVCVILAFALIGGAFYIAENAVHDCTGEDCHVCSVIEQYEALLTGSPAIPRHNAAIVAGTVTALFAVCLYVCISTTVSPVTLKVKLSA